MRQYLPMRIIILRKIEYAFVSSGNRRSNNKRSNVKILSSSDWRQLHKAIFREIIPRGASKTGNEVEVSKERRRGIKVGRFDRGN